MAIRQLIFQETPGAGTYTATVSIPAGSAMTECYLVPLAAPWDATTVALDVGDTLTGNDSYFSAYDFSGLNVYDPTAEIAGTNFDSMHNAGNDYDPTEASWPGVLYTTGDVLTAVVTTTGAGGSTGLLVVQFVGLGFGDSTHDAVKT